MKEKKFCPLSMSAPADMDLISCCREKCGWWDEDTQSCAVVSLAKSMRKVLKNA